MHLLKLNALRGINLWTTHTALQVLVRFTKEELNHANHLRIIDTLEQHELFTNFRAEMATHQPLTLAHLLAAITLHLQQQAGCDVNFYHIHPTHEIGVYKIIMQYTDETVVHQAFETAIQLCQAIQDQKSYPLDSSINDLKELYEDFRLGPSTGSIVNAAIKNNIPYFRLNTGSLVQFGFGSKQRRIWGSETDTTCYVAESIVQDKELTRTLLSPYGIPMPQGGSAKTLEEAWKLALNLGLPVVVKPRSGNQGKGVTVNITTYEEFVEAYHYAALREQEILVETYIPGKDYRLLVIGEQLVAAAHRSPPMITGDGQHTIEQLIAIANKDPRRGVGHAKPMTHILVDDLAIENIHQQGYRIDSILPKNQTITLRHNANLSSGGSAEDVTNEVHPEIAALAVEAAQIVGLNPCGIDFICESIQKPIAEQKCAIIELNASPGLRMHLYPSTGSPKAVGEKVLKELFADGDNGRIPVIAVTGTNGKTTTVRLINHILTQAGMRTGMTNSDGVYVNQQPIEKGDCSGPKSARMVLCHPEVDAAILETARGGILREGLGFDQCQVAVVTNLGTGDHLGLDYINTLEELALVKRTVVTSVAASGFAILNAEDCFVASMAGSCRGEIIYFGFNKNQDLLLQHHQNGGRCIYIENNALIASVGDFKHSIPLHNAPLTLNGSVLFQVQNLMAAVGAAWALNTAWPIITSAVKSFFSTPYLTPGRFNLFEFRGAQIIADYGHNPDAMLCLVQATETIKARKKVAVIAAAGDRQDEDIRKIAQILGDAFDTIILYEDQCQRGRADGEVICLLQEGLNNAKRVHDVDSIIGEQKAIRMALDKLEKNDLCLILIDQVEESLNFILNQIQSHEIIETA